MAIGLQGSEGGGVFAPADVRGAGQMEWAALTGVSVHDPRVRDESGARIVTTPAGQAGPAASAGGQIATPDGYEGHGLSHIDNWKDVFNFKGSPVPWLLLIAIGVLAFAHASIKVRAGAGNRNVSARAALE